MLSPDMIASVAVRCTMKTQWKSLVTVLHTRSYFFLASIAPDLLRVQTNNSFEACRQTVMVFNNYRMGNLSVGSLIIVTSTDVYTYIPRNNHCARKPVQVKQGENHDSNIYECLMHLLARGRSRLSDLGVVRPPTSHTASSQSKQRKIV